MIDNRCIPDQIVQQLKRFTGGRVHLAKELVDYDPEVENAINYVFGQFVSELFSHFYSLLLMMRKQLKK